MPVTGDVTNPASTLSPHSRETDGEEGRKEGRKGGRSALSLSSLSSPVLLADRRRGKKAASLHASPPSQRAKPVRQVRQ